MAYDPSMFEARRRGLMENYSTTGAANLYSNFRNRQLGNRNLADLRQDFEKAAPRVVAAYGERNLNAPNIKSGAFARAMKEFAQNRIKQESRAQQDLAQGEQQFNLGMAQLGSGYKSSLADLEADKAREIEQTAADLMRLRSGY